MRAIRTLLACMLLGCSVSNGAEPLGFQLPNVRGDGAIVVEPEQHSATVVCFLSTQCPLAKLYGSRLAEYAREFANSDVRFVGVNSNRQDSREEVRAFADVHGIAFPFGKDYRNVIADRYDVRRTPEVLVFDGELQLRYRGRIDDQYDPGISRPTAKNHYLRQALHQLLAGEPLKLAATAPAGCLISRVREPVSSSKVTYCQQISRVFQQHCVECHRQGEIGPFALTDYEEIVGWADMILEVVDNRRMPPWHASPDHAEFTNARSVPAEEKALLEEWVNNGMPYGDPSDLPPKQEFTSGWRMEGSPDLVLAMSQHPFEVPADGTVDYQYFVVDPGFEEDKWVSEVQVLPGNAQVVHHSILFIRPPDGEAFRGVGWLAGYVPGQREAPFPPGNAIRIPARSKLVFQQHYTPTGRPASDITQVGMRFVAGEDVTHEIYSIVGLDQEFEIPPGAPKHTVSSRLRYLPKQATLLSIMPHMHLRGRSFELWTVQDQQRQKLLEVPEYDFNWQHSYHLKHPLPLETLDHIEFTATFDNSEMNPVNPDPTQYVIWGDQTWEEMSVVFLAVSEPRSSDETPAEDLIIDAEAEPIAAEVLSKMRAEADRILSKFDRNQDGEITRYETPFAFRIGFRDIDTDGNNRLTREELEQAARWRVE